MKHQGLTEKEVALRVSQGKVNKISKSYGKTYLDIFKRNLCTFFNLLFVAFFVILLMVEATITNLTFICIALCNALIGIIQEIRSKRATDRLSLLSAGKVKVIRDGEINEINTEKIVEGDILLLEMGDEIPVDGKILEGYAEINESLLTGESVPVKKSEKYCVMAGTYIVSGSIFVLAEKVGNETYAAGLQKAAKVLKGNNSELFKSLSRIVKFMSIVIVPVATLLFISQYLSLQNFRESVIRTIGSSVSMIPAGMFLLTSVALAVGVVRLSKKKILTHDMYSIEMLARTDVLCFDKTGTLTDGKMTINSVIKFDKDADLNLIIPSYLNATGDKNQTAMSLIAKYGSNATLKSTEILPFSSTRKFSAVKFRNNEIYYLGAPSRVLREKKDTEEIFNLCAEKSQLGFRTLLLCKGTGKEISDAPNLGDSVPVALFIIMDHVREEVSGALKWFGENGVDVKVISGDNHLTASSIAKIAGVKNAESCISLSGMTDEQVREVASLYTVFGRVNPDQKAIIVDQLKREGKTVAISGDGVNDILAMKKADCSIAMGTGSDAARNTADLVLLENDFSVMANIVAEGRRVVNNIQRSSTLFLMKTFFTLILTFIAIVMSFIGVEEFAFPFRSANLILFEVFGVGVSSFFLALEPDDSKIEGSFLSNIIIRAFPAALTLILSVLIVMILQFFPEFEITSENILLIEVITFTFGGGFTVLFKICKPFNIYRGILFTVMLSLAIIALRMAPAWFFDINCTVEQLSLVNWLTIVIVILACTATYNAIRKFSKWILSIGWTT